jgi:hypothetical protein
MDYPGKVITKTQVTPTQTSASGNWTLDDQAAAIKNNNWPVALVPNPISKSLRFNSADSAYLNRTAGSPTNQIKWTFSGWIKRSTFGAYSTILSGGSTVNDYSWYGFDNNDKFAILHVIGGTNQSDNNSASTMVFRDPSAWYHIVIVYDSANATSANRTILYVNGVQQTISAVPSLNEASSVNASGITQYIAQRGYSAIYNNGYMTELNFIDGQALTPSSFGMTNPQTGQWIPLKYSGTYGTNGFYLNFKDATSTTTLGYDYSGNANNWTTNNFSVTAGVGNDSLTDVPTPWFAYNTTGDVGGVIRGNYATLNPLTKNNADTYTITNGNLDFDLGGPSSFSGDLRGTIGVSSGKWYWEVFCVETSGSANSLGITNNPTNGADGYRALGAYTFAYYNDPPPDTFKTQGTGSGVISTDYGPNTNLANSTIGFALDLDGATITVYVDGVSQGTMFSSLPSGTYFPLFCLQNSKIQVNFGQRPFAYTPPTGFRSLCTTNLSPTAIGFGLTNQGDDYFNPVLYTGNGTSQTISTGLQPDFIWIKRINGAAAHTLTDSVRGISKQLFSNLTDAEQTDADSGVTAISSSSITLGDNNLAVGSVNGSGSTYVAWNWKAGGTGVTNTAGTITSTVSANTTAGFSIVTFTGTGANATVGHGLGVAPSMYIVKNRPFGGSWGVYHTSIGATNRLLLNGTNASTADSGFWNNTAPTSTVFSVGTDGAVNRSGDSNVAYCFAAVPGYSAFGSYTGNGSADGPFVYVGFRPRYVMVKASSTGGAGYDWFIHDTARDTYNVCTLDLEANLALSENQYGAEQDILSNGFKLRNTGGGTNGSGVTYIYMAFAEFPFQFANAR